MIPSFESSDVYRIVTARETDSYVMIAPVEKQPMPSPVYYYSGGFPSEGNIPENLTNQSVTLNPEPVYETGGLVLQVLGKRASERFTELKSIQEGWNFGEGLRLSTSAESNFRALLTRLPTTLENPRLFLLEDGAIELQWRNSSNRRVSIISGENGFEVLGQGLEDQSFASSDYRRVLQAVSLEEPS
jgi:hypothetical protein